MMSEKSDFLCSFCLKILKNPINLPCFDIICEIHLTENNVFKNEYIECPTCKRAFNTSDSQHFVPNKIMKNLLDKQIFLTEEEKSLKKSLETSLQEIYGLNEQYCEAKKELDLKSHQHFEEIRFQIDLHREQIIEKIDQFYLEMIEKTKKTEASFTKHIAKNFGNNFLTLNMKTFEEEKEEINEKFREKEIAVNNLKEKQNLQEEAAFKIKSKLKETNQIFNDLKASNEFKPISVFTDKESFGLLKLNGFLVEKITGTVKWFNVKEGYGFITRDDTNEDIFIHQSSIAKYNPNKYKKSLGENEKVEFTIIQGDKGAEATNVTGLNDEPVIGSKYAVEKKSRHKRRGRKKKQKSTNNEDESKKKMKHITLYGIVFPSLLLTL